MDDYIERETLPVKRINIGTPIFPLYKSVVYVEDIAAANAADVVPVVRCKDCKHFEFAHDCNFHAADENGTPIFVREDDYCSYGERRE